MLNQMIMKKNIGTTDRLIRLLMAVVLLVLYFTGVATGVWGIAALIGAGLLSVTALVSFCGLYALIGISTCPVKRK
jgi:hypothetical protein